MWDFELGRVFGLMSRTMPYLIFRFLIYTGITLAYILVTGLGAGIGYMVGKVGGDGGTGASWGGILGFGLTSAALYFAREYLLYLVKAGHIAVLLEVMEQKDLPGGRGQIDYGQAMVKKYFKESSVLFGVDQLIKGVLKVFNRAFLTIAHLIPVPGLQGLIKFLNAVVNMSLTYVDEVILAYYIRSGSDNPWRASEQALVLYAQNYKNILKNAVFLTLFIWALTFVVFLLVLGPAAFLVNLFPDFGGFWSLVFAALLALGIKAAVIDPIAMTALMQVFFKAIEGQQPNSEWQAKLNKMSGKFRELGKKAVEYVQPGQRRPAPGGNPPPPPA